MPINPHVIDEKKIEVHYLGYYENGIHKAPITMQLTMGIFKALQRELQELIALIIQ